MADKVWYGVFAGDDVEPFAVFETEDLAFEYGGTVRPVRLRLLAPLHAAEPCVLHDDPD